LPVEFSSSGITHDIGKIIMMQYFHEQYLAIEEKLKDSKDKGSYSTEIELGLEGRTHCDMGAYFLKLWNMPDSNCETAMFHHTPKLASNRLRDLVTATKIANEMSYTFMGTRGSLDIEAIKNTTMGLISDCQVKKIIDKIRRTDGK
jgi:HD-like signal output (HDOD) protein